MQQKRNTDRTFLKSQRRQTRLYKFIYIIPIHYYTWVVFKTNAYTDLYTHQIATNHNNNNIKEISTRESDFDYTQCVCVCVQQDQRPRYSFARFSLRHVNSDYNHNIVCIHNIVYSCFVSCILYIMYDSGDNINNVGALRQWWKKIKIIVLSYSFRLHSSKQQRIVYDIFRCVCEYNDKLIWHIFFC